MALSAAEQTQIRTLATREGGVVALVAEIQALAASTAQSSALTTLAPAITVTVQDWAAVRAYVSGPGASNQTLYSVMDAIKTAVQAGDASQLGPLMVALYAGIKAHLSL
jgi:hypothetical protein